MYDRFLTADNDALTLAEENANKAMQELKKIMETGTPAEIKAAIGRCREASGAYRSLLTLRYHI